MKLRTLVVDADELARAELVRAVEARTELELVAHCGSGQEGLDAARVLRPDLVLLETILPGLDGFQFVRHLEITPAVIFVTQTDRYALRAFEIGALDYLVKPLDDVRFLAATARAVRWVETTARARLAESVLRACDSWRADCDPRPVPGHSPWLDVLHVRSNGRVALLRTEDVDWIEAANYYVRLHSGGRVHLLRESMGTLEKQLDPRRFQRIHRSTIVNLERVQELRRDPKGEQSVILACGTELRMARNRQAQMAEALGL